MNLNELLNEAQTLNARGRLAKDQGRREEARSCYEQSLAIAQMIVQAGTRLIALNIYDLGLVDYAEEEFDQAHHRLLDSLALYQNLADVQSILKVYNSLGAVAWQKKEYDTARDYFDEGIRIAQEHNLPDEADFWHSLGVLASQLNDYPTARLNFARALIRYTDFQDRPAIAYSVEAAAGFAAYDGLYEHAAMLFEAALTLRREIKNPWEAVELTQYKPQIAEIRAALGHPAFSLAWKKGRIMLWDEMMALAISSFRQP